jgi:hypothetical protein
MGFLSWLMPGNDHQLAAEQYPDRESATDRAARKDAERAERDAHLRRANHHRAAAKADRKGAAWETKQRRRYG